MANTDVPLGGGRPSYRRSKKSEIAPKPKATGTYTKTRPPVRNKKTPR